MPMRTLRCAIEQVADWYPSLFLEPHIVEGVAVMGQYSRSPARFDVECENVASAWLGTAPRLRLELTWSAGTKKKAQRIRAVMQSRQLVEFAVIAVALVIANLVVHLDHLDVTQFGDRADYRAVDQQSVLEVSGTERPAELGRRHRQKVTQALANPFGWSAYVVVCAFSHEGHQIHFS